MVFLTHLGPPPAAPFIPPAGALLDGLPPSLSLRLPNGRELVVKWTTSHSGGELRGYCKCHWHPVGCFKWRQANQFESDRHLAAFLYEWSWLAEGRHDLSPADHIYVERPADDVVAARALDLPIT